MKNHRRLPLALEHLTIGSFATNGCKEQLTTGSVATNGCNQADDELFCDESLATHGTTKLCKWRIKFDIKTQVPIPCQAD